MLQENKQTQIQLANVNTRNADNIIENNNIVMKSLHYMQGLSLKINDVAMQINDINKKIECKNSNRQKTIENFYNNVLGNDFSKLNEFFSNCSARELKLVYEILLRNEVKEHILATYFYPFIVNKVIPIELKFKNKCNEISKDNENNKQILMKKRNELISQFEEQMHNLFKAEDNNSANIIAKLNNMKSNINHNNKIIKDKIVDIIIGYINFHKNEMLQYENERIKNNLKLIKYQH